MPDTIIAQYAARRISYSDALIALGEHYYQHGYNSHQSCEIATAVLAAVLYGAGKHYGCLPPRRTRFTYPNT